MLALFVGGIHVIDRIFDTDILGAAGRMIIWLWRAIVEFFARLVGIFSQSLATSIRGLTERTMIRKISRPFWRLVTILIALFLLGQVRQDKIEKWFGEKQSRILETLKRVVLFKPDWPRWVRALIALVIISLFFWGFVWINEHIGKIEGFVASILLWMMVEKLKIIGLDALSSIIVEKWAPVKAFIDRHPWIRWMWLGPLFSWVTRSAESLKEWHGRKHRGKSTIEVIRENRAEKKREEDDKNKTAG